MSDCQTHGAVGEKETRGSTRALLGVKISSENGSSMVNTVWFKWVGDAKPPQLELDRRLEGFNQSTEGNTFIHITCIFSAARLYQLWP